MVLSDERNRIAIGQGVVRLRDIDVTTSLTSRPHGCSRIKCSCLNGGVQHGGSVLNPNSQPKTTRNTLPVHLLQNNSGKFVVFAFGRCSRHFIVVFKKENFVCSPRRFTASDFIATKPTQTQTTTGFTHLHTPGQFSREV